MNDEVANNNSFRNSDTGITIVGSDWMSDIQPG
jgi:hypothetical protein